MTGGAGNRIVSRPEPGKIGIALADSGPALAKQCGAMEKLLALGGAQSGHWLAETRVVDGDA
jgi:hypothetical protein